MNILITGTSRGIGYELVKLFSMEPGNKVFAISRNKDRLEKLADDCRNEQPYAQVFPLPIDITNDIEIEEAMNSISGSVEALDIIINNAGFLANKPFEEITSDELKQMYGVNILGPVKVLQNSMPLLKKAPLAHVVNISSMGGFQGTVKFPGLAAYASSKAAIASLTECLAEEYKDTHIKINCLALGAVQTEMLQEAFPGYQAPVTAKEMAEYIFHFAKEGHKMFNGKILPVSKTTP